LDAKLAPQPCIRLDPRGDPDHEAADALRQQSSETADPFSVRHEGHALTRVPPPRIDIAYQQTLKPVVRPPT
jgi:hypothetical protein